MRPIDFNVIDRDRFHVNEHEVDGLGTLVLIVPHKAMWSWEPGEEHLRSLLCRPTGEIVSSGFPKFYNFGEKQTHDDVVRDGLKRGDISFLEKVDGSLIIRSVIDGVVHFRTRGAPMVASDMRDDVMSLIRDQYPMLLDPSIGIKDSSLLMEYVGPQNQIVVKYDEPRLYALGWSDWSNGSLRVFRYDGDAWRLGLDHPRVITVPSADTASMQEAVRAFDHIEGIVTWTKSPSRDGSYSLCKFKSGWYLRLHALRSQVSQRYINEYCYVNQIESLGQLKQSMSTLGFDWEIISYIEPLFDAYLDRKRSLETLLATVEQASMGKGLHELQTRKELALAARALVDGMGHPELFSYALHHAQGEHEKCLEIKGSKLLDVGVAQVRQLKRVELPNLSDQGFELD